MIRTAHLLPIVETHLLELLRSLRPNEWEAQTVAPAWKVKDVAAHLLDTQLRKLSRVRDGCASSSANAQDGQILWNSIRTWSGSGDRQLDSFTSDTGALRIVWEARRVAGATGPGSLKIVLHSAISGRPLAAATVEHQGEGKGTAYVSEEPRVFFAEVSSQHVEWTITISERLR